VVEDAPPDPLGDLRDERVAERGEALHPIGNPISHSTHSGFRCPRGPRLRAREWTAPESVCRPRLFAGPGAEEYPFRASVAVGVGQVRAMCSSVFWTTRPVALS
jgi:hypothetical protein